MRPHGECGIPPWTSPPLAILDPHSHLAPTPFINQRDAADLVSILDIIPVKILSVIFAITAKVIFAINLVTTLITTLVNNLELIPEIRLIVLHNFFQKSYAVLSLL